MKRLKYGATKNMTPEELKQYKRDLGKRYRRRHPDKIKAQNKYYSELYSKTKPFPNTCVDCGNVFYASRSTIKHCPECREKKHAITANIKKEKDLRRKQRFADYKLILKMYKSGHTQEIIAETLGRSQSGISTILTRLTKKNTNDRTQKMF